MNETLDVAIIGAGHNGLVAAVMLARHGLTVSLFEDLATIGGAVKTEYPFGNAPKLGASSGAAFPSRPSGNVGLVEPLSDRELSVLRYLPSRLSNREIGAELFVSLNTVKSHLKTIYRKLDVERRDEAVRRARQLGLI